MWFRWELLGGHSNADGDIREVKAHVVGEKAVAGVVGFSRHRQLSVVRVCWKQLAGSSVLRARARGGGRVRI